jgi:predicted acetyltransferase
MSAEIRVLASEDEFRSFLECDAVCFAGEVREEAVPLARAFLEADRTMGAFAGGRLVGTCGNLTMELTVPGPASLPCAGVTWVSVLPSHRRQGILTAMMGRLLDDAAAHGEPLAVLLASESAIYGRFGYGLATQAATYEIDKAHTALAHRPATDGAIRVLMPGEASTKLPAIHEANRRLYAGGCRRSEGWWAERLFDAEADRGGASRMYHAVHEPAAGSPDGYVAWRVEERWDPNPANLATVIDHSGATDAVRLALLEFACRLDLVGRIRLQSFPVDEPLRWALAEPRQLVTRSVHDVLWVRILDVERCLAARSYGVADRIVLDVEDGFRPECGGRFVVDSRAGASCSRTDEPPDLAVTASDLGALYLGGVSAATLAAGGRLRPLTPGIVGRATRLFATERPPYGDTDF